MEHHDKISTHQLFCLLFINLMGTSVLHMSGHAASGAGNDGWISILIGAGLAVIYGSLITVMVRNHPDCTLIEIAEERFGRITGMSIGFLFWILLVVLAMAELRTFTAMIHQTLLKKTPVSVIYVTALGCIVYAALKGCECRARLAEITLLFIIVPVLLMILFAMPQVRVFEWGPMFMEDSFNTFYTGFRLSLFYIPLCLLQTGGCYVGRMWRDSIYKTVMLAIGTSTLLNLLLYFLTVGCLGVDLAADSLWPLLQVMAVVDIPILEIERQDALLMTFWILAEFTLLTSYIFHAGITWQKINHHRQHRRGVWISALMILLLAWPSMNIRQLYEVNIWVYAVITILFAGIVPFIFRKERKNTHV